MQETPGLETPVTPGAEAAPAPSLLAILRNRNFRLLWIGESISVLGDQFHLIALPWLVLQLTGDALAMGTVLAIAGIPRAVFMLVGGALTDRFSARNIMLASNVIRTGLVGLLAALTMTGQIELWMLYLFAFLFGLADAFFFPAQSSIVPHLVSTAQLGPANALIQGTAQLSTFAGPVLAGIMIALLSGPNAAPDAPPELEGIALALGIDAATFSVSALTLALISVRHATGSADGTGESVLRSIRGGIAYAWRHVTLRVYFIVVAAINLLVNGPIAVGIPVLADRRLPEGAAAFGIVMSAFGGGALLGMVAAAGLPRPALRTLGTRLLVAISLMGFGVAALGFVYVTPVAALISLLMGVVNGYVNILFITWLQERTPSRLLGRMMSLVMFASLGLNPLSTALAGWLIELNVTALFFGAGLLMATIALASSFLPQARSLDVQLAADEA